MTVNNCPSCGQPYKQGDDVCGSCGFVFPFSTVVLPTGTKLHGRYEIKQLIHSGGMGFVYIAEDKTLFSRTCVVKQVRDRIQSIEHRQKLEEEALRMAKLSHPT